MLNTTNFVTVTVENKPIMAKINETILFSEDNKTFKPFIIKKIGKFRFVLTDKRDEYTCRDPDLVFQLIDLVSLQKYRKKLLPGNKVLAYEQETERYKKAEFIVFENNSLLVKILPDKTKRIPLYFLTAVGKIPGICHKRKFANEIIKSKPTNQKVVLLHNDALNKKYEFGTFTVEYKSCPYN